MKLTAPYLKPAKWVGVVKEKVAKEGIEKFFQNAADYAVIPVVTLDWSDLVDEVYGGNDPLVQEKPSFTLDGDIHYHTNRIDEDSYNYAEDFKDNFLPELKKVAEQAASLVGVGDFEVILNDEGAAEINFILQEDELTADKKIPFKESLAVLNRVLADKKVFADFEGPLFERATVDVAMQTTPDGNEIPNPSTAKLILPDLTVKESQGVSPTLTLTVKRSFLDKFATTRTYAFTFDVIDIKFKPLANGLVRPTFQSTLKEYKNA